MKTCICCLKEIKISEVATWVTHEGEILCLVPDGLVAIELAKGICKSCDKKLADFYEPRG